MAAGGLLPPLILELRAKTGELRVGLDAARKDIDKFAKTTEGSASRGTRALHSVSTIGKAALLGLGGAAIALGGETLHLADDFELSHARLVTALQNTHQAMSAWQPVIKATDATMTRLGYTNSQTESALSQFVSAGLSQKQALDAVNLAANVAKGRGIDLTTATLLVTKAYQGNSGALRRMGIDLPVVTGNALAQVRANALAANAQQRVNDVLAKYPDAARAGAKGHAAYEKATRSLTIAQNNARDAHQAAAKIVAALADRYKNQAANAAHTFAGKLATLRAQTTNVGTAIGLWLVPKIETLVGVTEKVIGWLQKHSAITKVLAGVIGTILVGAILTYIGTMVIAGVQSAIAFATDIAKGAVWVATKVAQFATAAATYVWYYGGLLAQSIASGAKWLAQEAAQGVAWIVEKAGRLATAAGMYYTFYVRQWITAATNGIKFLAVEALNGAKWIALKLGQYAVVAAAAVASAIATAAAWIAANLAMIIATGGILLAIGALVLGALWLHKHWHAVWSKIKELVADAWHWIKSHISLIIDVALGPLGLAINLLRDNWRTIWGGIKTAVSDAWSFLKPIFDKIGGAISGITGAIGTVSKIAGGIGGAIGGIGHMLGFADGGPVPGPLGQPTLAVVHGGEYVLSHDMLGGRSSSSTTPAPAAASGGGNNISVNVSTNADPRQIASEVGWQLRLAG